MLFRSNDPNRADKVEAALRDYGVAVITEVFTDEYCNELMTNTINAMKIISPELQTDTISGLKRTWVDQNLMPQTRAGLFQRGYSFLSWPVRSDPKVIGLFHDAYSRLRGHPVTETVTSLDGINIRPPIAPFTGANDPDWAHLDQTESTNKFECIQGQAVLTNTTAGFRCSPKSHLVFNEILAAHNKTGLRGNWFKFSPSMYRSMEKKVKDAGGEWQVPIIAPRGSIIFWLSSTVHSAKLADRSSALTAIKSEDPWDQWRGVFYVCHRPKAEATSRHLADLSTAYFQNRTTNHWGTKIFPNKPGGRFNEMEFSPQIRTYISNPQTIYSLPGITRPDNAEIQKIGRASCRERV